MTSMCVVSDNIQDGYLCVAPLNMVGLLDNGVVVPLVDGGGFFDDSLAQNKRIWGCSVERAARHFEPDESKWDATASGITIYVNPRDKRFKED